MYHAREFNSPWDASHWESFHSIGIFVHGIDFIQVIIL